MSDGSNGVGVGRRASPIIPAVVIAGAVALALWAIVAHRREINDALDQLTWWSLPLSWAACLAGLLCVFKAWAALVKDAGVDLSGRQALKIYGLGQVSKYLPGGLWSVAMQAQMVREFGGSRLRTASASLVILLLGVSVSLMMGSALLPLSGPEARDRFWFSPLLAVGTAALLVPSVLNRASAVVARMLRQSEVAPAYSARGVLAACAWMVAGNLMFGLHVQLIGAELGLSGAKGYLLATSAYCLAASLGLLFIPAPAGAGVRELVMTVVLAHTVTTGGALVVALMSRVVAIVADLALATSQLAFRRKRAPVSVFLTRRFPPSIGGMETLAAAVWRSFTAARPTAVLIAHRGSNRGLLWWVPFAWLRITWMALRGRVDLVLAGDAPMFAVVEPVLRLTRVRRATMILGLDVTHENVLYRRLVLGPLRRAPQVIAISSATRDEAIKAGVPAERTSVLRLGVEAPAMTPEDRRRAREELVRTLHLGPTDVVLVTVGRLVRRKGSRWFVEHVLPDLPATTHYVVAGDGPERSAIAEAADSVGMGERVHFLGVVSDDAREMLMRGCDLFVQPNIPVPGDMEGFGLVTIEAATRGAVVVASDLEGLKDAVVPDESGYLVPAGDDRAWIEAVSQLIGDRDALGDIGWRFRRAATDRYGESAMAAELQEVLFEPQGATRAANDDEQHPTGPS